MDRMVLPIVCGYLPLDIEMEPGMGIWPPDCLFSTKFRVYFPYFPPDVAEPQCEIQPEYIKGQARALIFAVGIVPESSPTKVNAAWF